jgi:hypothetical protein
MSIQPKSGCYGFIWVGMLSLPSWAGVTVRLIFDTVVKPAPLPHQLLPTERVLANNGGQAAST